MKEQKKQLNLLKLENGIVHLKVQKKLKIVNLELLLHGCILKTTQNSATFNDYKNFIEQHEEYPRINRIKYLAETKIYLRNNSPTSIINWFDRHPPLGGIGKIKLAEAYLEQKKLIKLKT